MVDATAMAIFNTAKADIIIVRSLKRLRNIRGTKINMTYELYGPRLTDRTRAYSFVLSKWAAS